MAHERVVALCEMMDTFAEENVGAEARMNRVERMFIAEPGERSLVRMMESVGDGTREAIDAWTDPIVAVLGVAMWGVRIARLAESRRGSDDGGSGGRAPDVPPPPAPEPKPEKVRGNGHGELVRQPVSPEVLRSRLAGIRSEN
jgi:hypothetical protein